MQLLPLLGALLLGCATSSAGGVKRSPIYPVYSVPTPYVLSGPSSYSSYYFEPQSDFSNHAIFSVPPYDPVPPLTAVADLKNYGGDEVTGRVTFTQLPGGPVIVMGNVTGLSQGAHGFHVHEFGDLSNGCDSLGSHYNPTLSHHGGPADPFRHVGDLGNINADAEGKAKISDSDHLISLTGPHSVVGRGLVIHSGKDDFGRGGDKESLRTGNAGSRVACGVISWSQPPHPRPRGEQPPQQPAPANPDAEQIEGP